MRIPFLQEVLRMKKHILKKMIPFLLVALFLLTATPVAFAAGEAGGDVVILYVNDVHCGVDAGTPEGSMGYANLAALKKELAQTHSYVTLVDAGDAIQGDAIGTLSDGAYLVDIMNYVGFDYAVFGNHEFDYGMDVTLSLLENADAEYLACNFEDLRTGELVAKPYSLETYGDLTVAYVGVATPESFTKSTPTYFQDENGNYIYGFREGGNGQELYDTVQSAVDAARAEGADLVIALGHLGTDTASAPWRSYDVIANTTGLDAFIDGHSHSTIAGETVENKAGEPVILTSTGEKMSNIGKMTITSDGAISTELVSGYSKVDPDTDAYIKSIQSNFEEKLNEVVASSDVELVINDPVTGKRIIRSKETNLGDLVADAYRVVLGADIGMVNGGGIRAAIQPGDITYGDLIAVHPYGNMMCVVEAKGWEILDLLEVAAMAAPEELGSFMHVSGLKFTINTAVASSVVLDNKGMLQSIGDTRRVMDVQVFQDDGSYAPIDPAATYTLASHNYMIKQGGCSVDYFMDNKLLADEVMIDNQS
jgi:2',3'-cyclic-nucleotide 2'-phosphodiesterase (5'-nucleotidase family)